MGNLQRFDYFRFPAFHQNLMLSLKGTEVILIWNKQVTLSLLKVHLGLAISTFSAWCSLLKWWSVFPSFWFPVSSSAHPSCFLTTSKRHTNGRKGILGNFRAYRNQWISSLNFIQSGDEAKGVEGSSSFRLQAVTSLSSLQTNNSDVKLVRQIPATSTFQILSEMQSGTELVHWLNHVTALMFLHVSYFHSHTDEQWSSDFTDA